MFMGSSARAALAPILPELCNIVFELARSKSSGAPVDPQKLRRRR